MVNLIRESAIGNHETANVKRESLILRDSLFSYYPPVFPTRQLATYHSPFFTSYQTVSRILANSL